MHISTPDVAATTASWPLHEKLENVLTLVFRLDSLGYSVCWQRSISRVRK